ncbi:amidohydrolase [Neobittarella massiliensis]|uniref:Amidohydrolase n=1 Tax=Neobittarella massiliensis (ex Bilen et al. 2018) TaxID=2041842 RepID=A0A8J6M119_9FIRM|nr:amidohydrolase [Neobittarella massiliensis]MBC3515671.1 amidohydrolase [Neobittarella massiliensis]
MNDIRNRARELQDYVVAFRRDIHQHPEASLQEFRTTDRICEELDKLGISYRRTEPTGVIAEIQGGKGPGKCVALRGDIDALSLTEHTDLPFKSINDGFMHACGHDTHGAMLLGAARLLSEIRDQYSGTVRLLFQPAEEVCEGAKLMIEQGAMQDVDYAYGIHIIAQQPVGKIMGRAGATHAATDQYKITIKGKVCHGAAPHTGIDATVAAGSLIMNLQTMVSREFSPMEPLVVTIGQMHSGSRFNIVSGEAVLEGTIRSFNRDIHQQLPGVVERIAKMTAAAFRCEAEVQYDMITDVLICDQEATDLGLAAARKITDADMVADFEPQMGGEDFSEYTSYTKAGFFSLGGGGEWPQHSDRFTIDESAFETGVALYAQLALDALAQ